MALFSFGKKKEEAPSSPQPSNEFPVEQVMALRQQGYQDFQISEQLQSQGYNSSQIFDAMNQVNMDLQGGNMNPMPEDNMMPPQTGGPLNQQMNDPYFQEQQQYPPMDSNQGMGQQPQMDMPPPSQNNAMEMQEPVMQRPELSKTLVTEKERIEELAEAIIDEKWDELVKDVNKVIEWKEATESRIIRIEQSIDDVKQAIGTLQKTIVSKITDYDKNLSNVGVEIKAMEKVFQKVLPSLTDNVNRLERMARPSSKK